MVQKATKTIYLRKVLKASENMGFVFDNKDRELREIVTSSKLISQNCKK